MSEVIEYGSINTVVIDSTDWVSIGDTSGWNIASVGGVPIQVVQLLPENTPGVDTKPMFTVGGLINNMNSLVDRQVWCRVAEGTGILAMRPLADDGFEPITELRASVIGLSTEVIKLTTRATKLEVDNNNTQRNLIQLNNTTEGLQGYMAVLLSKFSAMLVDNALTRLDMKSLLRETLNKFQLKVDTQLMNFFKEHVSSYADLDEKVQTIHSAMNAMFNSPSINNINIAYDLFTAANSGDTELLQTIDTLKKLAIFTFNIKQSDTVNAQIRLYWDALARMTSATTVEQLDAIYAEITAAADFDITMLPVVDVVREMVEFNILSSAINTEQTDRLDTVSTLLVNSLPVIGTELTAEDLANLFGTGI